MVDANAKADAERRDYYGSVRRTDAVDRIRRTLQEHYCRHGLADEADGDGVPVSLSRACDACARAADEIVEALEGLRGY